MNKRFFGCAIALTMVASVVSAQDYIRVPAGTQIIDSAPQTGGTSVYQNDFLQIDPDVATCGAGVTCEGCGDFFITSIWTTGNARFISDDVTLGVGPRALVRYDFMVCGTMAAATAVDITSQLWTVNASGSATAQPGAPIAGTQTTQSITVDATFPCFILSYKPTPGIILPESMHLVVTSSLQNTASTGTYMAVLDGVEYGASANQFRRSLAGVNPPDPNDNADWGGAGAFSATPNCPLAGGTSCTAGCAPFANVWAHIYAEGSCGNGTIEVGEECDGGACCQACVISGAGVQCRASSDACDPAESCDGLSAQCPADMIAAAGVICRPVNGPCDLAEACDGINVECPPNDGITACIHGDGCCPSGCINANDNDCQANVPTVSEWGLAILTLIGLVVGTILFSRKRSIAIG